MFNLMIVDPQNDFCLPDAPLEVKGAMGDISRMAKFILSNSGLIDNIIITMDNHHVLHIANTNFWRGRMPNPTTSVAPYTDITPDMIGEQVTSVVQGMTDSYARKLVFDYNGGHVTAWPQHCITGTPGAAIVDELAQAIEAWSITTGRIPHYFIKGIGPFVEEYSAFGEGTKNLEDFKDWLSEPAHDKRWLVGGEAADYCVLSTVTDMIGVVPVASDITVVSDWTSWIGNPDATRFTDLGVHFEGEPTDGTN